MKKNPWTKQEISKIKKNLHLTINEMIKEILPDRTYWETYNQLVSMGYCYDFKQKKWIDYHKTKESQTIQREMKKSEEQYKEVRLFFKTMGNDNRAEILQVIHDETPIGGTDIQGIGKLSKLPRGIIEFHIEKLINAGAVITAPWLSFLNYTNSVYVVTRKGKKMVDYYKKYIDTFSTYIDEE